MYFLLTVHTLLDLLVFCLLCQCDNSWQWKITTQDDLHLSHLLNTQGIKEIHKALRTEHIVAKDKCCLQGGRSMYNFMSLARSSLCTQL